MSGVTDMPNHDGMAAKDPLKRRRALLILTGIFIGAALLWLGLWQLVFSTRESTDNAYVGGNQVAISAQVPGTVTAILTDDTQRVDAGQVLVKLDDTDATTRLAQARGALAQTVRNVHQLFANADSADAQIELRKIDFAQAEADLQRRLPLIATQAESPEIVQHLRDGVAQAKAALAAAQAQSKAAHAAIRGVDVEHNPAVLQARANFRAAWVAARRNDILAPVSGYIAKRSVQLGNSVQPGQSLMSIVPLHDLWVDANFKEAQLRHIRIGQPAELSADIYGGAVKFHGKVVGIGAGTGSVFALLPTQNASGNWIKVIQRVPVRIALDGKELDAHPLRLGLSAEVTVDIRQDTGPALAQAPNTQPVAMTDVYERMSQQADAEADRIVRVNL